MIEYLIFLAFCGLGVIVGSILTYRLTYPLPRYPFVDPVGWDEEAQRVHDVTLQRDGSLLHHSICWCRTPKERGHSNAQL